VNHRYSPFFPPKIVVEKAPSPRLAGETPILLAAEAEGHVLRCLLDRDGDPGMFDARGFTPLRCTKHGGVYGGFLAPRFSLSLMNFVELD
jgi:hypothetical protein